MKKNLFVWCTDCGKSFFCNDMISKRISKGKQTNIYCMYCGSCEFTVHYKHNAHLMFAKTHKPKKKNKAPLITAKLRYGPKIRHSKHWLEV